MTHFGFIEPPEPGHRWQWPFKRMRPGDTFLVRHRDREVASVRNLVYVTAHRMEGARFRFEQEAEPGVMRVTMLDSAVPKHVEMTSFRRMSAILWDVYRIEAKQANWASGAVGQEQTLWAHEGCDRVALKQVQRRHMVNLDGRRCYVELHEDRVFIRRVRDHILLYEYLAEETAALME